MHYMYDNTRYTVYNGSIYLYFFAGLVFKINTEQSNYLHVCKIDLEIRITPKFSVPVV